MSGDFRHLRVLLIAIHAILPGGAVAAGIGLLRRSSWAPGLAAGVSFPENSTTKRVELVARLDAVPADPGG